MVNRVSPANAKYIKEALESGAYQSESQVLDEALSLLKKRDALRIEVQAGIAQADSDELLPAEAVFAILEKRAQEIENSILVTKQ